MIRQDTFPAPSFLFLSGRMAPAAAMPGRAVRALQKRSRQEGEGWTPSERERCAALLSQEGLEVRLTVRTGAVLQDLDLLAALDRRHAVTIRMQIAALDGWVARKLEGEAPSPEDRLEAVATLAAEGLDVRAVLTPIVPGLNDGARALRRWVDAAREAGASDVELGSALHRGLFGRTIERPPAPHVRALFERLRLEYGFPRVLPGRG